jgi:hypothetical protein
MYSKTLMHIHPLHTHFLAPAEERKARKIIHPAFGLLHICARGEEICNDAPSRAFILHHYAPGSLLFLRRLHAEIIISKK